MSRELVGPSGSSSPQQPVLEKTWLFPDVFMRSRTYIGEEMLLLYQKQRRKLVAATGYEFPTQFQYEEIETRFGRHLG